VDPWRVLRPGDRVEKLIERALIERANQDKTDEMVALAQVGGVLAGQVVALSLGADPKAVMEFSALLMQGGDGDER
jgi:hypothetical protein